MEHAWSGKGWIRSTVIPLKPKRRLRGPNIRKHSLTAMTLHRTRFTHMNSGSVEAATSKAPRPMGTHPCPDVLLRYNMLPYLSLSRWPQRYICEGAQHIHTRRPAYYIHVPNSSLITTHQTWGHRILTLTPYTPSPQPEKFSYFIISPHVSLRGSGSPR
jgi:hypothetical protein